MTPPVAIIMRSKDEQPFCERALEQLMQQDYPHFTLYNVDSGSTDGTWEVICHYNKERARQIRPEDYMPGPVLNDAVQRCDEPIIVFLNADAIAQGRQWLRKLICPIVEDLADVTMSRQICRSDAYFIVRYDYERAFHPKTLAKNHEFFSAVACAFKRSVWDDQKFYHEGYSEDLHWSRRCQARGWRFTYVPESVVEHSHNYDLKALHKRKFIEGHAERWIYGKSPSFGQEVYRLSKELFRDFCYAFWKLEVPTIPYNIVYRMVFHLGLIKGRRS